MSREVPAEDLLVLARQCKLSEEEERRLEIALRSSRELEVLYRAGLHFDDQASLLSGDEARLSRLVERTLARIDQSDELIAPRVANAAPSAASRPSRTSLVVRYLAASLGVGLLLSVTLASAWDYVEKRAAQQAQLAQQAQQAQQTQQARRTRKLTGDPAARQAPTPAPAGIPLLAAEEPLTGAGGGLSHAAPVPVGPGRKLAASDEQLSSSELFARANQARREGDIEDAISLYERLGQAYPSSVEAEDAKIFRGNLLLSQRSPRAALRQFEDYHSGALSLEALWGRAQALRKLESPGEQALLIELVRDYPDSPYAEAARKRLRELAR
ncbi:MAG TPA: hypothetical protein VJV79_06695 [Polyangiaceae bacterium]|nr:hypothetical protein [Polyangiaceae bacterium]